MERDPECWSELVRRLEPLVYAVARKTGLSPSECDDCAQDTWLSLFKARRNIQDPNSLPAWLIRAVSRRAVRISRNRERDRAAGEFAEAVATTELPDVELERLESATVLRLAVASLPPRCQKLLQALYFAPVEKKYADIARDLGLPPNSLGPTRSRCLDKLRAVLKEMGYDHVLTNPDRDS